MTSSLLSGLCQEVIVNRLIGLGLLTLAISSEASVRVGGIASIATAFEVGSGHAQKSEMTLQPDMEWTLPNGFDLKAVGRFRTDAFDRLEPGKPSRDELDRLNATSTFGSRSEAELRELFVEGAIASAWVRLGKQQIVWGESDGLKVLDIVNPQSFREFILADFTDSRIPQWSAKIEWTVAGKGSAQLIWIPDLSVDILPPNDGVFAITARELVPAPAPGVPIQFLPDEKTSNRWKDGALGGQWSFRVDRWDFTLNAIRKINSLPTISLTPSETGVSVQRLYKQANTFGGSVTNSVGDFTFRGELAWSTNQTFVAKNVFENNGFVVGNTLNTMIGLDWMGLSDTIISGQLLNSRLVDSTHEPLRRRNEPDATLLIERTLLNQTVKLSALLIQDLDDHDGLISPRFDYQFDTRLKLGVRGDFFHGNSAGRFGQFRESDRLLFTIEYSL